MLEIWSENNIAVKRTFSHFFILSPELTENETIRKLLQDRGNLKD